MKDSISKYIFEVYNMKKIPGEIGQCIFCGRYTMRIKPDDSVAKCFHPRCNRHLHISKIKNSSSTTNSKPSQKKDTSLGFGQALKRILTFK